MSLHVPFEQRSRFLRAWHRKAAKNRLRGLTTHGQPRKRRFNVSADARTLARDKYQRRALQHQLAGLTTRGGQRVYRLNKFDRVVLAADFDALAATLAECYEQLPARAQAKAVELATRLGELKRRLG